MSLRRRVSAEQPKIQNILRVEADRKRLAVEFLLDDFFGFAEFGARCRNFSRRRLTPGGWSDQFRMKDEQLAGPICDGEDVEMETGSTARRSRLA
jgi:hypothetical protein